MVPPLLVTEAAVEPLPEVPEPEGVEGAGLLVLPVEVEPEELVVFFFLVEALETVFLVLVEVFFFVTVAVDDDALAAGSELADALGLAALVEVLLAAVSVLAVLELKPASAETWVPTA